MNCVSLLFDYLTKCYISQSILLINQNCPICNSKLAYIFNNCFCFNCNYKIVNNISFIISYKSDSYYENDLDKIIVTFPDLNKSISISGIDVQLSIKEKRLKALHDLILHHANRYKENLIFE